jgi:low temperature requirement protein LtrA
VGEEWADPLLAKRRFLLMPLSDRTSQPHAQSRNRLALGLFRRWFWRPPRPHGDTIVDRRVSPLELLYDLVYVAVISQLGRDLAAEVSLTRLASFVVAFSLIWIAWTNGSLYLELHGRPDGRTRTFVFVQMGILAFLAVFASSAGGQSGRAFAITYSVFLAVMTWLWYTVRRQDVIARPELIDDTGRYVAAMAVSTALMFASAYLSAEPRFIVWLGLVTGWIGMLLVLGRSRLGSTGGMTPTDSVVDRFGTFTLIVLGEVVFGVVDGLSHANRDVATIVTGMVALVVGFGFWWIYFDVVGGRLPKGDEGALANWILGHHPLVMSIVVAGVGMVSLIAHAHEARTPAPTAWLLSAAVAVGLSSLVLISRALSDVTRWAAVYRPLQIAMMIGTVVSVLIGSMRPAPWILASLLVVVLSLVWAVAVRGFLLAGAWPNEHSE